MFLSILRSLLISIQMLIMLLTLRRGKTHRKTCVMWTAGKSAAAQRGMWFPHNLRSWQTNKHRIHSHTHVTLWHSMFTARKLNVCVCQVNETLKVIIRKTQHSSPQTHTDSQVQQIKWDNQTIKLIYNIISLSASTICSPWTFSFFLNTIEWNELSPSWDIHAGVEFPVSLTLSMCNVIQDWCASHQYHYEAETHGRSVLRSVSYIHCTHNAFGIPFKPCYLPPNKVMKRHSKYLHIHEVSGKLPGINPGPAKG